MVSVIPDWICAECGYRSKGKVIDEQNQLVFYECPCGRNELIDLRDQPPQRIAERNEHLKTKFGFSSFP